MRAFILVVFLASFSFAQSPDLIAINGNVYTGEAGDGKRVQKFRFTGIVPRAATP